MRVHGALLKVCVDQRNLAFSDEEQKREWKTEALAALRPAQRMNMARAGTLEGYLNQKIKELLEGMR